MFGDDVGRELRESTMGVKVNLAPNGGLEEGQLDLGRECAYLGILDSGIQTDEVKKFVYV